ncbi:MAG: DDE-type integrase/transposase/recombinase [Candidatus Heimdallarchaeota archaeon]|nr:DDE-type integrase/transposase/recombinase [Candidatus Heimdallarchaeota archaeon]
MVTVFTILLGMSNMAHRRLSPPERLELVQLYLSARTNNQTMTGALDDGQQYPRLTVTRLCREYGTSRQTFYRWLKRFREEGHAGLLDRPAGRPRLPNRTVLFPELLPKLIRWRRWLGLSCRQLAEVLRPWVQVSHVTIWRLLNIYGVTGRVYKRRKKRWQRFERGAAPDELWHLDHSKSDFDGKWRLTILDDHSRFVLCCRVVPDLGTAQVCRLLLVTIRRTGGRRPRLLLSDNARSFRSREFRALLTRLGIRATYARVRHPQTLGKLERFHRTFQDNAWLFDPPERFVAYYNWERRHSGIGGQRPAARYWPTKSTVLKKEPVVTTLGKIVTRFG